MLTAFIMASVLLALTPGPDNLFVLSQSALYGPRAGISITLGLCTGLVVHSLAVVFGLAALIMLSATAFTLIKVAGATYLLYLAWQTWQAGAVSLDNQNGTEPRLTALYRRGILMNLSNPKVAIFFLAFLPQFVRADADSLSGQVFLLGLIFALVALLVFSGIALMAGRIATGLRRSPRAQQWLYRLTALVFTGLALRLFTSTR